MSNKCLFVPWNEYSFEVCFWRSVWVYLETIMRIPFLCLLDKRNPSAHYKNCINKLKIHFQNHFSHSFTRKQVNLNHHQNLEHVSIRTRFLWTFPSPRYLWGLCLRTSPFHDPRYESICNGPILRLRWPPLYLVSIKRTYYCHLMDTNYQSNHSNKRNAQKTLVAGGDDMPFLDLVKAWRYQNDASRKIGSFNAPVVGKRSYFS